MAEAGVSGAAAADARARRSQVFVLVILVARGRLAQKQDAPPLIHQQARVRQGIYRQARDFATLETVVGEVAAQVDWQARLMARPGSQDAVARIGTALRRIAAGSRTAADRAHPTRLQDANT